MPSGRLRGGLRPLSGDDAGRGPRRSSGTEFYGPADRHPVADSKSSRSHVRPLKPLHADAVGDRQRTSTSCRCARARPDSAVVAPTAGARVGRRIEPTDTCAGEDLISGAVTSALASTAPTARATSAPAARCRASADPDVAVRRRSQPRPILDQVGDEPADDLAIDRPGPRRAASRGLAPCSHTSAGTASPALAARRSTSTRSR